MRIEGWAPEKITAEIEKTAMDRLEVAANFVKAKAQMNCPVGTISRPMYKTGRYAGQPWTARDAGALRKTIRVVRLKGDPKQDVRIYAGNKVTFYAAIVEFFTPFLRRALNSEKSGIMAVMQGAGSTAPTAPKSNWSDVFYWKPKP